MLSQKKNKKGLYIALLACLAVLALVVILENTLSPTGMLFIVLRKSAVYALVVVSMNLLNGFTGLFSLGQAGFMLLGAYTYAILTVPVEKKATVYYLYGGTSVNFSITDFFQGIFGSTGAGGGVALVLTVLLALILAGCVAALFAWLIGLPVLRLKSDYLAIATLGFAEIIRAIFQWDTLGPITNGANMIKSFPGFSDFNIDLGGGNTFYLSTFVPFLISMVCIGIIVLLINSSYGRAFKSIREDEIAAEAMGVNLSKHKMLSFCISSFFAGVGGAMFAMLTNMAQARVYTSVMTYELLLIVVLGGIGSISGSCIATFLYVAASEWWLRGLDAGEFLGIRSPLFRTGFRMVVFSVIIMVVVLFFRQGLMGDKELPDLFKRRKKQEVAK
ncbi:MAG TPA: branched-chain amino acid ABC transporter permease [Candidatus Flavonifractor merdigallinarum]|uniref:Branched-chain amino acid ABC transporter permease n=1 Tax=Candidatus Flavonifractor merdigallinarum TaxID=2838589 RepID=A0A9D1Y841_9FIRM|nr:branched-chain amino acid ABC transporter permease [Candidatus Flavonifractor merdigallinarum]